mgnify:CR=1 FL=1
MEAYEVTIYNIRTLQGEVRYEENPVILMTSVGILVVVLLVVVAQNAEASEEVSEMMLKMIVETHERMIYTYPQVKKFLEQAA